MSTKKLEVASLIRDYAFYPRSQTDEVTAAQYAESLALGAKFPPILVCAKTLRIIDGFTRVRACEKAGVDEIECELVTVKDDQDLFLRAAAANTHHGRRYTPYDIRHIIQRSRELGIKQDTLCETVEIPSVRYQDLVRGFGTTRAGAPIPLKRTIAHMAGKQLNKKQQETNKRLGGMQQSFYANQLIDLIESDLLDVNNPLLIERLRTLHGLLAAVLKQARAAV